MMDFPERIDRSAPTPLKNHLVSINAATKAMAAEKMK
jgi:hypothetical protein